jgi:hypothetical protein
MKITEQAPDLRDGTSPQALVGNIATTQKLSVPAIVASAFDKFEIALRARLLSRLLGSVGPLALAVVGGGVFAKYLRHARWPEIPVSFEDATRATSSQVYDLVRYVEQSDPQVIAGLFTALSQDGATMTAIGASIAAMAVARLLDRNAPAGASSVSKP